MSATPEQSLTTPELRHMGVQVLIKRTPLFVAHQHGRSHEEVLLVDDCSKAEVSAGLPNRFTRPHETRWHIFSGGRQVSDQTSQPESSTETLRREWLEEHEGELQAMGLWTQTAVQEIATALEDVTVNGGQDQQFYPYVVGQRGVWAVPSEAGKPVGEKVINEVAATTVYLDFDTLPFVLQRELDNLTQAGKAWWVGLSTLVDAFTVAQATADFKVSGREVRPQLLTAALIYHWQQQPDWDPGYYQYIVEKWNRRAYRFLARTAKQEGIPLTNGTMTTRGSVRLGLPTEDYLYLNTPQLNRKRL